VVEKKDFVLIFSNLKNKLYIKQSLLILRNATILPNQ